MVRSVFDRSCRRWTRGRILAWAFSTAVAAGAGRAADVETVQVDLAGPGARDVVPAGTNGAFFFNGSSSSIPLPADLPKKIGARDFSVSLEFQAEPQTNATAYLLEHHQAAPWTGLYLAIENNRTLRFRLKDMPHCDVLCDVSALVGDGTFHHLILNRVGRTMEIYIDGRQAASGEREELVDLDIDYGGNLPVVGSHCGREDAFYRGALRHLAVRIGAGVTAAEAAGIFEEAPAGRVMREARAAASAELQALVGQIRTGDAAARARARADLRALDPARRAALTELKDDPDPEVRETIRELLDTPRAPPPP